MKDIINFPKHEQVICQEANLYLNNDGTLLLECPWYQKGANPLKIKNRTELVSYIKTVEKFIDAGIFPQNKIVDENSTLQDWLAYPFPDGYLERLKPHSRSYGRYIAYDESKNPFPNTFMIAKGNRQKMKGYGTFYVPSTITVWNGRFWINEPEEREVSKTKVLSFLKEWHIEQIEKSLALALEIDTPPFDNVYELVKI